MLLIVGLVWLFWRVYRKSRRGLAWFFGMLAVSAIVFLLLVAWLRQNGQPYYLYLDVASDTWLLALDVLILSLVPLLDAGRHRTAVEMPPV